MNELNELESAYKNLPLNKRVFLDKYAEIGVINATCQLIGMSDRTVRSWKEHDLEFASLFDVANEAYTQKLELELYRRALDKDAAKMSDVLLMFALKARRPNIYRENVTPGVNVGNVVIQLNMPAYDDSLALIPSNTAIKKAIEGEYAFKQEENEGT